MASELNERQRQAVEHVHGPMLVLAGAGTGKTTVLVHRLARLIADKHARADEMLAITYSDNAAAEMRARVAQQLGAECALRATTFHAYCLEMLQRCGAGFGVLDQTDLWVYLRQRIRELPLEHFRPARNPAEFLHALLAFFERCHDELITPDKYAAYVERVRRGQVPPPRISKTSEAPELSRDDVIARCAEIAQVFAKVEQMLRADGLGTFGHMISGAIALLKRDAALLARERARARFILIDEFQDANVGQIELAALLAGSECNVFAVGDPDQAIYRFRGASSAAFEEFRRRFPGTKAVVLNENQRSTSKLLSASFALINKNPAFTLPLEGKAAHYERQELVSARALRARRGGKPFSSEPVEIVLASAEEEAGDLATVLEKLHRAEGDVLHCAVLYRQHSHRDELARELAARKVPFTVRGLNALETPDVRDAVACLGVLASERDHAGLFRVASLPMFALEAMRIREELHLAGRNPDMPAVLKKVRGGEQVLRVAAEARAQAQAAEMQASAALDIAIRYFRLPRSPALLALRGFVVAWHEKPLTRTGKLDEFLEYLEYFRDANGLLELPTPEVRGAISLMSVHAAKGLEFRRVFVLRAASPSFPIRHREALFEFPHELREISQPEVNDADIHREEERRLFYVAMTRAKDALTLYAKPGRGKDPRPAGFLRDLMAPAMAPPWFSRAARPEFTIHAGEQPRSALGAWLLAPPALPLNDMVLSATAIQTYKDCPLAFKIRREWNVPGEVGAALLFGNAMHLVLKGYYDALRAGRPQSEGQLLQCFLEALGTQHFEDDLQRRLYERQGLRQLTEFFVAQQGRPAPEVLFTERTFEITVGGVRVRGRIDRIDRLAAARVAVTDYKTGSARNQKHADESLQLSIYALACREWKLDPERLVFYNLETNDEVSATRTAAALQKTAEEVGDVAAGIAAGNFQPSRGFHCRSCMYRQLCPETEEWIGGIDSLTH